MSLHPVLIAGRWRPASSVSFFRAENPATGEAFLDAFPVSDWADCDEALSAATEAAAVLRVTPSERIAIFLETFATRIEARAAELVESAHRETGLPVRSRR